MDIYVATQPLVIARDAKGSHVYVYRGQGVPAAALDEVDAARLVKAGFLVKRAEAKPTPSEDKPVKVAEILKAVGEDRAKAAAALEAERALGDEARSSLVTKLEALLKD